MNVGVRRRLVIRSSLESRVRSRQFRLSCSDWLLSLSPVADLVFYLFMREAADTRTEQLSSSCIFAFIHYFLFVIWIITLILFVWSSFFHLLTSVICLQMLKGVGVLIVPEKRKEYNVHCLRWLWSLLLLLLLLLSWTTSFDPWTTQGFTRDSWFSTRNSAFDRVLLIYYLFCYHYPHIPILDQNWE